MTTPENPTPDTDTTLVNTGDNVRASWNFSLHDVRVNMAHCKPEAKEALISAFLWCIDPKHPVSRYEFAQAVGYDPTTIYKIFAGKYTKHGTGERLDVPSKLLSATLEFLRLERERFLGGGKGEFVLTPTARKIYTACDLARESQTPVFLWGVSHIGKTTALEHYAAANNHGRTVYVRMLAASGLGGMVRRINERLGNSDKCNTADAISRIKRAIGPNMVLILDELHLLVYTYRKESFFGCLEVLREIYDETGCGMVLCGTNLLLEKTSTAAHGELEQLFRRGVHKVPLPTMPTKADIACILEKWGLEFPDRSLSCAIPSGRRTIDERPYEMLRQLAKRDGLKAITERLRYGRKLAAKKDETLEWRHVAEAHLRILAQATPEPDWD
jgi:DNA transposition AAA+ family ATPase